MSLQGAFSESQHPIHARAELYHRIRDFMAQRSIIEVETPYLSFASNSDPNIQNLHCQLCLKGKNQTLYLHSSPEFPMKRLLAERSEPIYQIARVFRDAERGKIHHPEFSMLEWYRPGFDHHQLMGEMNELLLTLGLLPAKRLSYADAFQNSELAINPHLATADELASLATQGGLVSQVKDLSSALDFLFSKYVAPGLGNQEPVMIYDYPSSQAALAKLQQRNGIQLAARFELFIQGMEIANGYHELNDADELTQRFENEMKLSQQRGLVTGPLDSALLESTSHLPDCAGVALGLDRLLMILLNKIEIDQVLCFPVETA